MRGLKENPEMSRSVPALPAKQSAVLSARDAA